MVIFGAACYFIYRRRNIEKWYDTSYASIENLKAYEFFKVGPVLYQAPSMKFEGKYQNREEYHAWLDNDIRQFG